MNKLNEFIISLIKDLLSVLVNCITIPLSFLLCIIQMISFYAGLNIIILNAKVVPNKD